MEALKPEVKKENLTKSGKVEKIIMVVGVTIGSILGIIVLLILLSLLTMAGKIPNFLNINYLEPSSRWSESIDKPVIYFYPTEKTDISVQLQYEGEIIADYPKYDSTIEGWKITAYPDGRIIDWADELEYSYIFWEGIPKTSIDWDLSQGFVVKGSDTREFLQKTLLEIGLTPKEYNEFIVYWYPLMKDNTYNLIHFAGSQYTEIAKLTITPEPDSILRVFMVFKPLDKKIDIEEQEIYPFERKGFTVIEWGGSKVF